MRMQSSTMPTTESGKAKEGDLRLPCHKPTLKQTPLFGKWSLISLKKTRQVTKIVRTQVNIVAVRESIEQSPSRSRGNMLLIGISTRTVRRILHYDHHLHPYKMMDDG
ncbi:hypothetical protein J6590_016906 [Homalodisca vitripennis]|nr:hypothetical protein J6590_016906 [Homalodisca vitripennis]